MSRYGDPSKIADTLDDTLIHIGDMDQRTSIHCCRGRVKPALN